MLKSSFFISLVLILSGCAIISSPTGGEKDETPPQISKATPPNKTTNFNSQTIIIEFDEYIELKNFSSQFYSSPPLINSVKPKLKGKKLTLNIEEELNENTTYTFSFGNSLQDITESNIQSDYKYVFSTGDELDSLQISGKAFDAFTGLPKEGLIAVLYPVNIPDTVLVKQKPLYYAITDANGEFSIENLSLDTFQVFAIKDENVNLTYDHGAEEYGFVSTPVSSASNENLQIRVYTEVQELRLTESKSTGYGKIMIGFSKPIANLIIDFVEGDSLILTEKETFIEPNEKADTVTFWYNPATMLEGLDFVLLNIQANDFKQDSVRVLLKDDKPKKISISLSPQTISPDKTIVLNCTSPITQINKDSISVTQNGEQINYAINQKELTSISLDFDKSYEDKASVTFLPGAIKTLQGNLEDTVKIPLKVAREQDLSTLDIKLGADDNTSKIFQLYLIGQREIIVEEEFQQNLNLHLIDLKPEKYAIRIIWDENENGKWDVGEFISRKQPEQVRYYPNNIELRANWELEIDWAIPKLQVRQ